MLYPHSAFPFHLRHTIANHVRCRCRIRILNPCFSPLDIQRAPTSTTLSTSSFEPSGHPDGSNVKAIKISRMFVSGCAFRRQLRNTIPNIARIRTLNRGYSPQCSPLDIPRSISKTATSRWLVFVSCAYGAYLVLLKDITADLARTRDLRRLTLPVIFAITIRTRMFV